MIASLGNDLNQKDRKILLGFPEQNLSLPEQGCSKVLLSQIASDLHRSLKTDTDSLIAELQACDGNKFDSSQIKDDSERLLLDEKNQMTQL